MLESAQREDKGRRHFTVISFFKMEKDPEKPLRLEQGINWPTQYINHVTDSSILQKKKNTVSSQHQQQPMIPPAPSSWERKIYQAFKHS